MIVKSEDLPLLTDLYELTMAQGYFQERHNDTATFSLFIRKYPPQRGYLICCGLQSVLEFLEGFSFSADAVDRLRATRIFSDAFLEYLASLHFTGTVRAIPEGRLFFRDEPLLEVTAPIIEAQLVETLIINQMNLQCLIATKAARCVHAAHGREVVDFALRRTQGVDAGMKVARASYIAGATATSNVLAGVTCGIPLSGTMAHSFVSSFDEEIDAFRAFCRSFPERSILLIETYDAIAGAHKAVQVAREMATRGQRLRGVRIDSGDLLTLGLEVRRILDEAGLHDVQMVGSGGLDEYDLEELSQASAPYNAYGIGTKMGISADGPWTDMAYKLASYGGRPVLKLSAGKVSLPGAKQVHRFVEDGRLHHDVIALEEDAPMEGEPLLEPVMANGRLAKPLPSLSEIRERCREELARLGDRHRAIRDPEPFAVMLSPGLQSLKERLERSLSPGELKQSSRPATDLGES